MMKNKKNETKKLLTLQVQNLTKIYTGNIKACDNVSISAYKGDVIALLGPNGAGKSTFMNMVAGFLAPSAGNISVLGKDIFEHPLFAKENIGFLPEGSPLYPDLTVKMFLKYMAGLKNVDETLLTWAMKTAKIEDVAAQKIETLSKGYQRRVGFAQSILNNPPILLLDEPTDGLDPNQKEHMRKLIADMAKDKTILISTHLLEEAQSVCNRIMIINKGKIRADGNLTEILKNNKVTSLAQVFKKLTTEE